MRLFTLIWLYLLPLALCASTDTVRLDDGVMRTTNQARSNWEESIILNPGGPCRILEAHIYYGAGSGADVVYLAGDAAEGDIQLGGFHAFKHASVTLGTAHNDVYTTTQSGGVGLITLTESTPTHFAGTFSFTGVNLNSEAKDVKDGVFRVKIQ